MKAIRLFFILEEFGNIGIDVWFESQLVGKSIGGLFVFNIVSVTSQWPVRLFRLYFSSFHKHCTEFLPIPPYHSPFSHLTIDDRTERERERERVTDRQTDRQTDE